MESKGSALEQFSFLSFPKPATMHSYCISKQSEACLLLSMPVSQQVPNNYSEHCCFSLFFTSPSSRNGQIPLRAKCIAVPTLHFSPANSASYSASNSIPKSDNRPKKYRAVVFAQRRVSLGSLVQQPQVCCTAGP